MRKLVLFVFVATSVPSSAIAQTSPISGSVQRDIQCLTLALVAAGNDKDPGAREGIVAEAWYFLGRLDTAAPGVDLKNQVDRALAGMSGDPRTKDIGAACDAEFTKRGADLVKLGSGGSK